MAYSATWSEHKELVRRGSDGPGAHRRVEQITERVVAELSGSDAEVQARDYRHKLRERLRYAGSNAVYYVVTQRRPLDRPPLGEYGAADCEPLEED